jgi:excisionase family DNA binding protein
MFDTIPPAEGFAMAPLSSVQHSESDAQFSDQRLLTAQEPPVSPQVAACYLNMHRKTLLHKAREGVLPGHPVGKDRKRWHFYLSELDHWLRSQVVSGSHPRRETQGEYIG